MDLNALRVFAKVAQAGSFTRAAALLDLPKSTVSRRVAALERRLGARLIQRTTRRMTLTEAGRACYAHCERALAEAEAAERAVGHLQGAPRGLLRVAAPSNLGPLIGPLVAEYLRQWPEVEIDFVCANRSVDLIEDGFELAIRLGEIGDEALVARGLLAAPSVLVASPEYLAQHGAPMVPQALADHRCSAIGSGPFHRSLPLSRDQRLIQVPIRGPIKVNDFDILREAALAGLGIVLLPTWRCIADLTSGRLCQVLAEWTPPVVPMYVVFRGNSTMPPHARAFVELLVSRLPNHPAMQPIRSAGRSAR
jgi:DNA-binding transcriptional LysR family regulator